MIVACERIRCRIACPMVGRVRKEPVPDRVPYGRSRARGAGARLRALWSVACERSRCRIACPKVGRVRKEPVPDRVPYGRSRAVSPVAGSRAGGPVARSRLGVSLLVSATSMSLPCSRSGEPNTRHQPCPGPTWRGSRRRHRRFTNMYSFIWPWRFIVPRSAARLRWIVRPPNNGSLSSRLRNCEARCAQADTPRFSALGIGVRENHRSIAPMPRIRKEP